MKPLNLQQKEESALNGKSIIQNAIEIQLQNDPLFKKQYETNYRDWETDRKSTRLNSSHSGESRMPSSA